MTARDAGEGDVRVRAGCAPTGKVGLESGICDEVRADRELGGCARGEPCAVPDGDGDRIAAGAAVAMTRSGSRLRARRAGAVAEVEAVAGNRRRIGIARARGIGADQERRRARRRADAQERARGLVAGSGLDFVSALVVVGPGADARVRRVRFVVPTVPLDIGGRPAADTRIGRVDRR